MRFIDRIVLHCTSGWGTQSSESIFSFWKNELKWSKKGYHILINLDGSIERITPLNELSNGVAGFNSDSVHICYKGGLVRIDGSKYIYGDTRSDAQKEALYEAINIVMEELKEFQPVDDIIICGHRDLSPDLNGNGKIEEREWVKICPAFDVFPEYGWIMGKKALERWSKGRKYW